MLKKLRLKSKLTQEKLAFLTGLSVKTISSIENGKECNTKTLKRLADFFEEGIEELIKKDN